jgi:7-cyano-7-deazaguanine synthase in queuosine biosynthesis
LLKPLSRMANASYLHLPIYFRADPKSINAFSLTDFPEHTRRTRSFFYLAQAAAFALSYGIQEIYLFENGVLALNLPIRADRTGARTTRHAHPIFLNAMQSFLQSLDERDWLPVIYNPFASLTKADILQYGGQWSHLISNTVSCWDYGNFTATLRKELNRKKITHCGFCLPCLVRRLALKSAGVSDPPSIYGYDVFQAASQGFPPPVKRKNQWAEAKNLIEFAQQINQLDKWSFYHRYIDKLTHLDPLRDTSKITKTHEMMRQFANDVITYFR